MKQALLLALTYLLLGTLDADAALTECQVEVSKASREELTLIEARCVTASNLKLHDDKMIFNRHVFEHRAAVKELQKFYSSATMMLVVILVIAGLTLTALEFRRGTKGNSVLKVGGHGIEIDSRFVGLAVLALSLAFAYLFLTKAYPITEIGSNVG